MFQIVYGHQTPPINTVYSYINYRLAREGMLVSIVAKECIPVYYYSSFHRVIAMLVYNPKLLHDGHIQLLKDNPLSDLYKEYSYLVSDLHDAPTITSVLCSAIENATAEGRLKPITVPVNPTVLPEWLINPLSVDEITRYVDTFILTMNIVNNNLRRYRGIA